MLTNMIDDLPTTVEITPGTISIERKAIGGTSWSAVVTDEACSEAAGLIYYDEVFDAGSGYAEGDSLRFTFKSQKVSEDGNDYEISDVGGLSCYSEIRQTMRGTDGANTATPLDASGVRTALGMTASDLDDQLNALPTAAEILAAILDGANDVSNADIMDNTISAQLARGGTGLPFAVMAVADNGDGSYTMTIKKPDGVTSLAEVIGTDDYASITNIS